MTNREEVFDLIQKHPEGLDDDDICELSGIEPRQQVQQLCSQLASAKRILRQSVDKPGKRRKIHNFPLENAPEPSPLSEATESESWRKRLSALVAATGRGENELLEESLLLLAMKVLDQNHRSENGTSRKVAPEPPSVSQIPQTNFGEEKPL